MCPGNFWFFSTSETEEPFFIPLGAAVCQSAFVGKFVHGKTFALATVQMGIIGKNRKEGYGLWALIKSGELDHCHCGLDGCLVQ